MNFLSLGYPKLHAIDCRIRGFFFKRKCSYHDAKILINEKGYKCLREYFADGKNFWYLKKLSFFDKIY